MTWCWHNWGKWQDAIITRTCFNRSHGEFKSSGQIRRCFKCGKVQIRDLAN